MPSRLQKILGHWGDFGLLAILAIATRIPFASQYLYSWDAAQFGLALQRFSLAEHQPHPPGYVLYIALGKVSSLFFSDANQAFVAISVLVSACTVMLFYALVREFVQNRRVAFFVALLFLCNPLFWFFGEVAATYIFDAFFATLFGLLAVKIFRGGHERLLILFAFLLAVAGGFRESLLVLFSPLLLVTFFYARLYGGGVRRATFFWSIASGVFGLLLWFLPLVHLAGGWQMYHEITATQLHSAAGDTSALFGLALPEAVARAKNVAKMFLAALNIVLAVPLLVFFFRKAERETLRQTKKWWLLFSAWLAPSCFVYFFIHLGNIGYLLTVLPALLLLAVMPLCVLARRGMVHERVVLITLIVLCLIEVATFVCFRQNRVFDVVARKNFWYSYLTTEKLRDQDRIIDGLLSEIRRVDPAHAVVVTEKDFHYRLSGTETPLINYAEYFRQIEYYLPEYDVVQLFGSSKQFFRVKNDSTLVLQKESSLSLVPSIDTLFLVADELDRDAVVVSTPSPVRVRAGLPLFVVHPLPLSRWEYAGYTFEKK